jgi:hypothetical protein
MAWLEGTAVATWTRESPSIWAYPTILTLHTVGLGIVVGASAVVDLRVLGYARRMRIAALLPLFRIIWWAFALNAATGCILFMADATTKSKQTVFYVKLALIALALVDTMWLRRLISRQPAYPASDGLTSGQLWDPASAGVAAAQTWNPALAGPSDSSSTGLKRLAILSLLLWAAAITAGRLMAYL